jgi:hypothetical protein
MKLYIKSLIFLLFFCVFGSISAAHDMPLDRLGDARVSALGGAYTAITDDSNSLFLNPAGLRLLADKDLSLRIDLEDFYDSSILTDPAGVAYPNQPVMSGELLYTSQNWGLAAFSEYYVDFPEDHSGGFEVDAVRFNSMQFGMGFGLGPLSFGANIKASQRVSKTNIPFENSNPTNLVTSFVNEVLFGEFNPNAEETVKMGAGALLTLGSFTFGAYSDTLVDFMYGVDDRIYTNIEQVYKELEVGAAYQGPAYDRNGNYRPFQLVAAADVHNLGDDERRTFSLGFETNFRFLNFAQLALRTGYQQPLEQLDDLLFGLEPREGKISAGAGVVLPFIKVDASASIPTLALLDPEHEGDLRAQVTFGFSF